MYVVSFESAKRQVRRIAVLAGVGTTLLVSATAAQATPPIFAGQHAGGRPATAPVASHGGGGRGHKVA